ncbi:hypothetical protein VB264_09515 [Arcicella aquatica]|uniref:Uncharacterized protein n=1 Tax=Arcicella aquatica TaxID=217141 RepID=A0ABU5QNM0_9BACT|nr:hypothetical protein [Arcicella aquatica]MEA5258021.1 hypothetical protein [Arcicella aquatica]
MTIEERGIILENHITTEIIVNTKVLGFDNEDIISSIDDVNNYFELPPPVINEEILALVLSIPIEEIRLFFRTYFEGGKVLYKKHINDTYIVKLFFKNNDK